MPSSATLPGSDTLLDRAPATVQTAYIGNGKADPEFVSENCVITKLFPRLGTESLASLTPLLNKNVTTCNSELPIIGITLNGVRIQQSPMRAGGQPLVKLGSASYSEFALNT